MTTARTFRPPVLVPQPPPGFTGSWPEYVCFRELVNQGLRPDLDFTFQSSQLGGRLELGGLVIDFLFYNPPGLGVEVNSVYYHYVQDGGINKDDDIIKRQQMAGLNYRLIFIDDDHLLRDPGYYVSEALAGRDHSRLG